MNLKDGITKAYETHWSMINTFTVQFNFPIYLEKFLKVKFDDSINLHVKSLNTPDFQNNPIEVFVGNRWRIQNGRDELYKFSITFRDKDQMRLYKTFYDIYRDTKEQYFDNCSFTVRVIKDADYMNESNRKIMEFNGTLINNISNIAFSNESQSEIAEFTVDFKCVSPNIY